MLISLQVFEKMIMRYWKFEVRSCKSFYQHLRKDCAYLFTILCIMIIQITPKYSGRKKYIQSPPKIEQLQLLISWVLDELEKRSDWAGIFQATISNFSNFWFVSCGSPKWQHFCCKSFLWKNPTKSPRLNLNNFQLKIHLELGDSELTKKMK
jgi:hypothetical protein